MRGTILEAWERKSGFELQTLKLPIPMGGIGVLEGRISTEDCRFRFRRAVA